MGLLTIARPAVHASAVLLALTGTGPRGSGHLLRATMDARLLPDSSEAEVRMAFTLRPDGQSDVPLAAVLFGDAQLMVMAATLEGQAIQLQRDGTRSRRFSASVRLPPATAAAESVSVAITYLITHAADGSGRLQIPVLAVMWPPAEATPGVFVADLMVPSGFSLYDAFPAVLAATGPAQYRAELSVLPAVIAFRVATGRPPAIGLAGGLDMLVIGLLLVFGWVGWRRFRLET